MGDVVERAGRQVVEHEHLVTVREQRLGQVRTDEAGAAGDERFHVSPVLESVEVLGDGREIPVAQSWLVQRQRQYFIAGLIAPRAVRRAGECERRLPGHRHRVVHERLDAVRLEMTLERCRVCQVRRDSRL